MEQLISSALLDYPTIQARQAQKQAAEAGVDSATWQFFPTPSIAVENTHTSASDPAYQGDDISTTLRLQQPIWTGGRLTAGLKKAEAGVISSQASLDEVRQQLALRIVQTYGDWLAAYLRIKAYDRSMATHVRLRELVKRRVEQGISAENDLILVVSRLESIAADLLVAHAQKDTALARLGQLLGRQIDASALNTAVAAPRPVNADLQTLLNQALSINPTIQRAQAQASVQEAVIAERRSDLSPEVYVRAERQYGNPSYRDASPENRLFIGVSSHFGAGLSSLSNIEGAKLQHRAALEEVEAQNRTVNEQVIADHALAVSSEHRLAALKVSLKAAENVSESYDRQFLAGRRTWQDTMNAVRELVQIEVQIADTQAIQILSSWRLSIYTQGLAAVSKGA
ncbi:MAG: TolC family protein [Methylobacter tundripaludum]|nr:TolC family protein [Methylobacter tundripaludum]